MECLRHGRIAGARAGAVNNISVRRAVSGKGHMAPKLGGRPLGFPRSAAPRKAMAHRARWHAKGARQRQGFVHPTRAEWVKRFGALATEALSAKNRVSGGGSHKKGLNREIPAASPAVFLKRVRTQAEEAQSRYEEAPTQEIKPTQRCRACGPLPNEKKRLSERPHPCPHCAVRCGHDDNATLVLLRWLEARLAGIAGRTAGESGSGREPSTHILGCPSYPCQPSHSQAPRDKAVRVSVGHSGSLPECAQGWRRRIPVR